MPRFWECLILICFSLTILAAQNGKNDHLGTWTLLEGYHTLSDKISLQTIGSIHQYETFQRQEFLFACAGVTYTFGPKLSTTLGYAYMDSDPFSGNRSERAARQDWIYEQVSVRLQIGKLQLSQRVRHDNRWIQSTQGTLLRHRGRYRLQLVYPITKVLYTRVFDEVFLNLQERPFNQNRLLIGLGYKVHPGLKIETGYLKHHVPNVHYDRMCLGLVFKTNFQKKQKG